MTTLTLDLFLDTPPAAGRAGAPYGGEGDARDGEIVVALVGEEATVKTFYREPDHIRLQPENDAMEPIRTREVRILGRVVGLMRSM